MVPRKEWGLQTQKLFPGTETQAEGEKKETKEKNKIKYTSHLPNKFKCNIKSIPVLFYLNLCLNMVCLFLYA